MEPAKIYKPITIDMEGYERFVAKLNEENKKRSTDVNALTKSLQQVVQQQLHSAIAKIHNDLALLKIRTQIEQEYGGEQEYGSDLTQNTQKYAELIEQKIALLEEALKDYPPFE